jgi:hypothetical protein
LSRILVVCPSYKRQTKIAECIQAWKDTTSGKSRFLLVLESGDTYPAISGIQVLVGQYGSVGKAMNAAVKSYPDYDFYCHINDDHHFKTPGWEEMFIDVLKDGGYAYGNDLLQKEKLATQVCISGDIVRKLGYMAHPTLDHLYVDDYWMEIGRSIGKLHYLPDLIIEHVHPGAGKAVMDAEYQRVNTGYDEARKKFDYWKDALKGEEVAKLQD